MRHLKNVRAAWNEQQRSEPERYQDESPHHGLQIAGTGLLLLARINRLYQEHLAKLGKRRRDRQRKAIACGKPIRPLAVSQLGLPARTPSSQAGKPAYSLPLLAPPLPRGFFPFMLCNQPFARNTTQPAWLCASTSRRTVFKPSKERRTRDA